VFGQLPASAEHADAVGEAPVHYSSVTESLGDAWWWCDPADMDDVAALIARNDEFIEACRNGSWAQLRPVLAGEFRYLDGRTGEPWDEPRYIADLEQHAAPSLAIDGVVMHVAGNTAVVSARTTSSTRPGKANRYVDTYERRDGEWLCVHACVWPLPDGVATVVP
jgi:hypothetical protein